MTTRAIRSPWQVTWSVWKALFLREFLSRVTKDRLAWFWMLFEPMALVLVFVGIRAIAFGEGRHVAGAEFIPWLLTGLLGFFLFREQMMQLMRTVPADRVLFAYRQVKPVDPVLVRSYLEGTLKTFIFALFIAAGELLGLSIFPDQFLQALVGWLSLWLLGLGVGLTLSVLGALVPEVTKIATITSLPLLLISGVMFPVQFLPQEILQYLLLNPILHGLEFMRVGFFEAYRPVQGLDVMYLWYWILGLLALGLILHTRFELRMKAQ